MSDIDAIKKELRKSTEDHLRTYSDLDNTIINESLIDQKWTIGQIIEHVILTNLAILSVLEGDHHPSDREVNEKVKEISSVFVDRKSQYKAFGPLMPSDKEKDLKLLKDNFVLARNKIEKTVKAESINEIFTGFEHFYFGYLTGAEWFHFIIEHDERHRQKIIEMIALH